MDALNGNEGLLTEQDRNLVQQLIELDQQHLFLSWPPPGEKDTEKKGLLEQLQHLNNNYTGGLAAYIKNAKRLLEDSRSGKNAFEGFKPSVPDGKKLDFGSDEFKEFEELGVTASKEAAFVLVAGGLGERLGYSGIKVALPTELASGSCFLALEKDNPFAVQTKPHGHGDVHALLHTSGLLKRWVAAGVRWVAFFQDTNALVFRGLPAALGVSERYGYDMNSLAVPRKAKEAIGGIASLRRPDGTALTINVEYNLLDPLLRANGWADGDVNDDSGYSPFPGTKTSLLPCLKSMNAQFRACHLVHFVPEMSAFWCTLCIVMHSTCMRKQLIGPMSQTTARCVLISCMPGSQSRCSTSGHALRCLCVSAGRQHQSAGAQGSQLCGGAGEDAGHHRRVCQPQVQGRHPNRIQVQHAAGVHDAGLPPRPAAHRCCGLYRRQPGMATNFTVQVWAAYSPVKNSPADAAAKAAGGNPSHSATSGELDIYKTNCAALRMAGATIEGPEQREFNGLTVDLWPRVSWSPSFAITFADLEAKVDAAKVRLSRDAALVITGADVHIKSLDVDGALVIDVAPGASLVIDGLKVQNKGWKWQALNPNKPMTEEQMIRGFLVCRREALKLEYQTAGSYHYPDTSDASKESVKSEATAVA